MFTINANVVDMPSADWVDTSQLSDGMYLLNLNH